MAEPPSFDGPESLEPVPTGGIRRWITVAVVGLLLVSMVFLAWVSGRGELTVVPATPEPSAAVLATDSPEPSSRATELAVPAPSSRPEAGPVGPRLAVVEADGKLFTMDGAGNGIVRLGDAASTYQFPAWSPDGRRLAAISAGARGGAIDVFGDGAATSNPAPATVVYESAASPPFYVYWSPNGADVAFLTNEPDGIALRDAPADGHDDATIVRRGSPMYWAWSGDRRLLVHSGGQGAAGFLGDVGTVDGAGDPIEPASAWFRAPAVSGDGRYRAFAVPGTDGGLSVVAASADGSGRREVPVFGGAAFTFEPAGDSLAFLAATEAGAPEGFPFGPLRLLDPATGGVRTVLPGGVVAFFWSPDGRTIASIQAPPPENTVVPAASSPSPGPGGVRVEVVFVDPGTGAVRSRQVIRVGDLFVSQVLPFFDQYALSHRFWAPDSGAIVLPIVTGDGADAIAEIRVEGGEPRVITPGVAAFWSP